jgi:hypothetical protein
MSANLAEIQELNTPKQSQSLGGKIDELFELRERYRELTREVKELKEIMDSMEIQIMNDLDSLDLRLGRGSRASVSISETVVPTVNDWDAFYNYVRDHDAMYLFERRVAATAWREITESGETVTGTEAFTKRSLSLRKVS